MHVPRSLTIATFSALLCLSACKKGDGQAANQPGAESTEAYKKIEKPFDETEPKAPERAPVDGIDLSDLDEDVKKRFNDLADTFPSPCGKSHSLRTSRNIDTDCKRAPFAVSYLYEMLSDGASDNDAKEMYGLRFGNAKPKKFLLDSKTPFTGTSGADVQIVEFYDYGCPACAMMNPLLTAALEGIEDKVTVYYKQFPLSMHPDSQGAAQAALAAHRQGKFKAMHDALFANQKEHKFKALKGYAKDIGLNMGQWEADYKATEDLVKAEKAEGELLGIEGTPAVFINGYAYEGPSHPKYMKMWLDEFIAGAR